MNKLNLQSFYPDSLRITDVIEEDNQTTILMKSQKHKQEC